MADIIKDIRKVMKLLNLFKTLSFAIDKSSCISILLITSHEIKLTNIWLITLNQNSFKNAANNIFIVELKSNCINSFGRVLRTSFLKVPKDINILTKQRIEIIVAIFLGFNRNSTIVFLKDSIQQLYQNKQSGIMLDDYTDLSEVFLLGRFYAQRRIKNE